MILETSNFEVLFLDNTAVQVRDVRSILNNGDTISLFGVPHPNNESVPIAVFSKTQIRGIMNASNIEVIQVGTEGYA